MKKTEFLRNQIVLHVHKLYNKITGTLKKKSEKLYQIKHATTVSSCDVPSEEI